jgi:hypothetical protein
MAKRAFFIKAGGIAATAALVVVANLGIGAQPLANTNVNQAGVHHGNKYGKLRSTTHEQRMAAAARRAALMKQIKGKNESANTATPAQNNTPTPANP